ncbi:MAG: hypothetical protein AABZ01_01480, partial [Gemmatimonadota bacterium]
MQSELTTLPVGLLTEAALAAMVAAAVYSCFRAMRHPLSRSLVLAWSVLSVYSATTAVAAMRSGGAGDLTRILLSILSIASYYSFAILLGDGLLDLARGRALPSGLRTGLLAGGVALAVVSSLVFLGPSATVSHRYFVPVGLRVLLVGAAVLIMAALLLRKGPGRTLGRVVLGVGLLGWGLIQLHFGITSFRALYGFPGP